MCLRYMATVALTRTDVLIASQLRPLGPDVQKCNQAVCSVSKATVDPDRSQRDVWPAQHPGRRRVHREVFLLMSGSIGPPRTDFAAGQVRSNECFGSKLRSGSAATAAAPACVASAKLPDADMVRQAASRACTRSNRNADLTRQSPLFMPSRQDVIREQRDFVKGEGFAIQCSPRRRDALARGHSLP